MRFEEAELVSQENKNPWNNFKRAIYLLEGTGVTRIGKEREHLQ